MANPPLALLFRPVLGCSRLAEFEAVAARMSPRALPEWTWCDDVHLFEGGDWGPHPLQLLPPFEMSDHGWLAAAAEAAVSCIGVFEVLGSGTSPEECARTFSLSDSQLLERVEGSWCFRFRSLGPSGHREAADRTARVEVFHDSLRCLEDRPVDLASPQNEFYLLRSALRDRKREPIREEPRYHLLRKVPPPEGAAAASALARRLDAKKRPFLSPSSMPAERALLMANLALTKEGEHCVLDPFCGSAGLLLAASALGSQTVGGDLDAALLSEEKRVQNIPPSPSRPQRGTESVSVFDNFLNLGLREPKRLHAGLDAWSEDAMEIYLEANNGRLYDAVLSDPPYGRREFLNGTRGWEGQESSRIMQRFYEQTIHRLVRFSAGLLRPGGRLVFMMPVEGPKKMGRLSLPGLREKLEEQALAYGFSLTSSGCEAVNSSLYRATILMIRSSA
jgi:tRNA G10  N-methylase Trm11